jgi:hypothetical protein
MTEYDRFVVTEREIMRPDLIAWDAYQDVRLWWVVCYVNSIANPFEDLEVGMVLKIPSLDAISAAFADEVSQ